MGGFKRPPSAAGKSSKPEPKKPRQTPATSARGARGGGTGRGRATKRKNVEEEDNPIQEEEVVSGRKHDYFEEDEEDDLRCEVREDGGITVGDIYIPPKYTRTEHELKGERLIIEKIVCENFKSYGGIKEMGPFHKSFSAIVGPNGNGKSNMIDAMLFVFGYRATKVRCKKTSSLIHCSDLLKNVESAAVTVHFVKVLDEGGEDDQIHKVPNSEIKVTRRVSKDNTSHYYLDGKQCTFHEVAAFLKLNGIDIVHNRFLILQGEVESIAQMPAKRKTRHDTGLLEFLEDVIGTRRYNKCLSQLEDKVTSLNFDREAKLVAVDLVEKEKTGMQEPVKKAKGFLREKNELYRNKHKLYQFKKSEIGEDISALEKENKKAEEVLAKTTLELEKLADANKEQENIFREKEKANKTVEHEKNKIQKEIDASDTLYTKVTENLQRHNKQRHKIKENLKKSEKELEELEKVPVNAQKEIKVLEKRRAELDDSIGKEEVVVEKEMKKVDAQVEKLSKENEGFTKNFMDLKKLCDGKKEKFDSLKSEVELMKSSEETEKTKLEGMKTEFQDLKQKIQVKERESRSSLGNKVGPLEQEIKQKNQQLEALKSTEIEAKTDADNTRIAHGQAREVFENSQTNDAIYKAFWAEKKKGRFEGVYGRLKDLATIDEKYNVAATVASGFWDHWVVDTDATGEEAIKFLRDKGLPFQNFQCLNKLQKYIQSSRKSFKAPQNSHRLFDLIKISKPELSSVFYKALHDTLVADNLDIASKIAYGPTRYRVTSVAGELIDPSGQMTGGGRQRIIGKLNGRMAAQLNKSISEQDFRQLKKDMETALEKYNQLSTQRQNLELEIRNLVMKLKEISTKMDSSKSDLESMKNQFKLKEKRLAEQEQKTKEATVNPKLVKEKEKLAEKAEKEFEEASEPCKKAEAEVKKVAEKLKIIQGEKRKEIRKKLDAAIEQRKKVIDEYDKHSVAIKNYEKNHEKLERKIENFKNEMAGLENEMTKLGDQKKETEAKAIELAKRLEKINETIDGFKDELRQLKSGMTEYGKKRAELQKIRVAQENDLSNATKKYKDVSSKVKAIDDKLAELKLDKIPEEDLEPFTILTEDQLKMLDVEELQTTISKVDQKLKKETPNLLILEQYRAKVDEFMEKVKELDDVTTKRNEFVKHYTTTVANRLEEFMSGYAIISTKLKEMFRMISMGGDAELDLMDSTDPFSYGISISVRPAKKSWRKIINLSGGEKTLASLALIFALHQFKPSPFYVMDEIDAALDFKNVSIIANYIKDRTKFTQFIIISLRSNMFELADSMLGVFKVDNMSYSIHLGVTHLLEQLRRRFQEAGRPFPMENEFRSNNRNQRQLELEKITGSQKPGIQLKAITNAEFSFNGDKSLNSSRQVSNGGDIEDSQQLNESQIPTQPIRKPVAVDDEASDSLTQMPTQPISKKPTNMEIEDEDEEVPPPKDSEIVAEETEEESEDETESFERQVVPGTPDGTTDNDSFKSCRENVEAEVVPATPEQSTTTEDEEDDDE